MANHIGAYAADGSPDIGAYEASASSVDALLADDVEVSTEVSTPTLGQVHVLLADDVQSTAEVSTPTLGQVHVLSADDVEVSAEVSTPSLGQVHVLLADDVEATTEVSSPALDREAIPWSLQAWRYSLAGIPDPALPLDRRQLHQTLLGATLPQTGYTALIDTTLGGFTVELEGTFTAGVTPTYSFSDRLAFVYLADPTVGFDYDARLSLGGAPGASPTTGNNRQGKVSTTLAAFTADLDGTAAPPLYEGELAPTLGTFVVEFLGENLYTHFFDISYSVTPTWVVYEQPARFGDVDITIGAFTSNLDGYALPPDSTQGLLTSGIAAFSTDFDGSFTPAPSRDGDIQLDVEVFSTSMRGTATPAGGVIGRVQPQIAAFSTDFDGTFEAWSTDGDLAFTLGSVVVSGRGQFIDASAISGDIDIAMGAFTSIFQTGEIVSGSVAKIVELSALFDTVVELSAVFDEDIALAGSVDQVE